MQVNGLKNTQIYRKLSLFIVLRDATEVRRSQLARLKKSLCYVAQDYAYNLIKL